MGRREEEGVCEGCPLCSEVGVGSPLAQKTMHNYRGERPLQTRIQSYSFNSLSGFTLALSSSVLPLP